MPKIDKEREQREADERDRSRERFSQDDDDRAGCSWKLTSEDVRDSVSLLGPEREDDDARDPKTT